MFKLLGALLERFMTTWPQLGDTLTTVYNKLTTTRPQVDDSFEIWWQQGRFGKHNTAWKHEQDHLRTNIAPHINNHLRSLDHLEQEIKSSWWPIPLPPPCPHPPLVYFVFVFFFSPFLPFYRSSQNIVRMLERSQSESHIGGLPGSIQGLFSWLKRLCRMDWTVIIGHRYCIEHLRC